MAKLPFGDRRNVQWDPKTKQLMYDNSSKRYKENIKPLKDNFSALLNAEPKSYTRPGNPREEIGYIAENFHELGLTHLVDYDSEGRPDGINYEKICLYLTENAKAQQEQIEQLKATNKLLEGTVTALTDRQEILENTLLAISRNIPNEKMVKYDSLKPKEVQNRLR